MVNFRDSSGVSGSGATSSRYSYQSGGQVVQTRKDFSIVPARVEAVSPGDFGDWAFSSAWDTTTRGPDPAAAVQAEIYRKQPAVRTAVGFLARNVAQVGIHVFDRINDTDRKRLGPKDHPLAAILRRPMPLDYKITTYRLIHDMVSDLCVFDRALWLKVRTQDDVPGGLMRIPPANWRPKGTNPVKPEGFYVFGTKGTIELNNSDVVYFHGYAPANLRDGVPPLSTLADILFQDSEGGQYRKTMWSNMSRISGYIQRPETASRWGPVARSRFREEWDAQYRGDAAFNAVTPILEDGMTFVAAGVTPEQAQYIEGRQLTRSEVASAYFIQPAMLGIPNSAGFSSIKELHTMLYQDTLGPMLEEYQQEIELQLLSEWEDPVNTTVYVEFNINDKLKGSFEEQAGQMSTLVGRPIMTANEGRARINLPSVPEGEGLVTPLNVTIGGQPNPQTPLENPNPTAPATGTEPAPIEGAEPPPEGAPVDGEAAKVRPGLSVKARVDEAGTDALSDALSAFFARQEKVIVAKLGAEKSKGVLTKDALDSIWNAERWDNELTGDIFPFFTNLATHAAVATLTEVGENPDEYDEDRTLAWLLANASGVSSGVNGQTRFDLLKAITEADNPLEAVLHLFDVAKTHRAKQTAADAGTSLAGFGTHEAIQQTGKKGSKTWIVTSDNPRDSHKRLDGTTIDIDAKFVNGGRWPGDTLIRDIKERARCTCDLRVELEE